MRLALTILISVITIAAYSQTQLKGVVKDVTGEEMVGTNIYLLNNWRIGTSTGINGEFIMEIPIDSKNDSLVISFVGYKELVIPILEFKPNIVLVPIDNKLEEVVVKASPLIAEEFKYQKINKIEIYTNPSAKADPILAVNSMPSSTTADESANISLRGASPVETGIFLNDVPIYDGVRFSQLNGIGTFSIFNTSIVKNLSLFAGNPPIEYGNVTSGLISLSTDDRILEANQNTINASLANIGYNRSQKISKNTSLMVFANYQPSNLIKGFNQESLEAIEDFKLGDLGIYLFTKQKKLTWKLFNYSILESYDYNFRSPSYNGLFTQSKARNFTISKFEYSLKNGSISINNGFSASKTKFNYSASDNRLNKLDWFGGINYQLIKEKYQLKAGISSDNRSQEIEGSYPEFGYALGENHPFINYRVDEQIEVNEIFAYGKYYFTENIIGGAGIRKNLFSNQRSYVSGQGNLQFKLSDKLKWILGAGKYHKNALSENSSGTLLISSRQLSSDLIYQSPSTSISVSLFQKANQYDDESINFWGAEFFASKKFSNQFDLDVSYTYLNQPKQTEIPDLPNIGYFIRSNMNWKFLDTWTLNSNILYRQGNLYTPIAGAEFNTTLDVFEPLYAESQERLTDYLSVGLSINKLFFVSEYFNIISFASANNVFDRRNVLRYVYNSDYSERKREFFSRRLIYFGVAINF